LDLEAITAAVRPDTPCNIAAALDPVFVPHALIDPEPISFDTFGIIHLDANWPTLAHTLPCKGEPFVGTSLASAILDAAVCPTSTGNSDRHAAGRSDTRIVSEPFPAALSRASGSTGAEAALVDGRPALEAMPPVVPVEVIALLIVTDPSPFLWILFAKSV
jgi:hypothetical protein